MKQLVALLTAIALTAGAFGVEPGRPLEPLEPAAGGLIDLAMYHDPALVVADPGRHFHERLEPLWLEALARDDAFIRLDAARAFHKAHERGMTGLGDAAERLVEAVRNDASDQVRLAAAEALVAMGHESAASAFVERLRNERGAFVFVADRALAAWDHESARALWLARAADQDASRQERISALEALGAVGEPAAMEAARNWAFDASASPQLRLAAARTLGQVASSGLTAEASQLAEVDDGAGSDAGAGMIDRLTAALMLGSHTDDAAHALLERLTGDANATVAATAVATLHELDAARAARVAVPLVEHADAAVRDRAVRAIATQRDVAAAAILGGRLDDASHVVRNFARTALIEYEDDAALRDAVREQIDSVLADAGWRGCEQAALLAAAVDHKPAAQRLGELLAHDRPEARLAAANALRVLAVPETLSVIENRARALTDSPDMADGHASHEAAQLLMALGVMKHSPADALMRRYVPKNSGFGSSARSAAIWSLGLLHEGEPDNSLAGQLASRLSDESIDDPESEDVRRFSAITIGRMNAQRQRNVLQRYYESDDQSVELRETCRWALEQIAGEPLPPVPPRTYMETDWFLEPVD